MNKLTFSFNHSQNDWRAGLYMIILMLKIYIQTRDFIKIFLNMPKWLHKAPRLLTSFVICPLHAIISNE